MELYYTQMSDRKEMLHKKPVNRAVCALYADMPSNVGAKMEQLNLKFTDFAQNTCTAHYLIGLEKKGLLLNWIGSLCVHNCVKLSVMIDHRNALNLLAVQIVQWKIVRQKAANMCLKASEKTSADPAGPLPPSLPVQTGRNIALPLKEMVRS